MRVRLDLGYDGTAFSGWAIQPGRRTVQGVLEAALAVLARAPVSTVVAGRTDAGVHATGQVAHADLDEPPDRARLNGLLPGDVRVFAVRAAPEGFDARFSATARRYAYRVADRTPDPLRRHDTVSWRRPLDTAAMNAAAHLLLGEHDFAAFCRRRPGASTVRTLLDCDWAREPAGVLVATVRADAFCHSMVRSLVGALCAVGEGRRPVHWPAEELASGRRCGGAAVAPAHGLTLVEVSYPQDAQLASRAQVTRARRQVPPARC